MVCDNCKKLRKELRMVETELSIAQPESWSVDEIYRDAFYGEGEFDKPDKEFAEWYRKKWSLTKIED